MITHEEAIKLLKRYGNDQEDVMELYKVIEDEISDLKHNYKAINEMFNNSVIYGAKIQVELNELKKDVARYFKLRSKSSRFLMGNENELRELLALEEKLLKVGKE